jgi:hemerythrin-like domain-containing protein
MTTATVTLDAPADTRMMGIVHSALRRDLRRAQLLLEVMPAPDQDRREALADHLVWCMVFLHHHHTGEDDGLYPLVVRQNPDSAGLVSDMDREHEAIVPAIGGLEAAAREYRSGGSSAVLLEALETLCDVLLPHLAREELEMMPVVSASITEAQWRSWTESLKKTKLGELAFEGHWLLDGIDAEGRAHLLTLVPAVPRFILVHLMGGPYRRVVTRLWAGTDAADLGAQTVAEAKGGRP